MNKRVNSEHSAPFEMKKLLTGGISYLVNSDAADRRFWASPSELSFLSH